MNTSTGRQLIASFPSALLARARAAAMCAMAGVFPACGNIPIAPEELAPSGAAAFSWGSFYDTPIEVENFFGTDHSIMVRFMPEYERAYEGPLISAVGPAGSPAYSVAMDAISGPAGANGQKPIVPAISVHLGAAIAYYAIPNPVPVTPGALNLTHAPVPSPPVWRTLFVVRRNDVIELWLDNNLLCREGAAPPNCNLPVGAAAPRGHLRLGRRPIDTATTRQNQFYGFIDDVAVFDGAFSTLQLAGGAGSPGTIKITEQTPSLRIGLNFNRPLAGDGLRIRPPGSLSGNARIIAVEPEPSALDVKSLPTLENAVGLELPFAFGEVWTVIQEFATSGSHAGGAAFCWDMIFVPASAPRGQPFNDSVHSEGRIFRAATPGTVEAVQQQFTTTSDPPNFVVTRLRTDALVSYLHLHQGTAKVTVNATVAQGDPLGLVSNVGGGGPHLHIAVVNRPETLYGEPVTLLVTRPSFFINYCASDDFGLTWNAVSFGMPRSGQWLRHMRSLGPDFCN